MVDAEKTGKPLLWATELFLVICLVFFASNATSYDPPTLSSRRGEAAFG
jgi:hypothetical protein